MSIESNLITNKIFTAKIDGKMDLCSAKLLRMPNYNPPKSHTGGILYLDDSTYLIFENKVLILGNPNPKQFTLLTKITLKNLLFAQSHYTAEVEEPISLHSKQLMKLKNYKPPSKFTGGVLKLPGGTYLLFDSGKVVINGVKTEPDLLEFTLETDLLLDSVQMSHCSGHIKFGRLDLEYLSKQIQDSNYEPDLHPGLTFHIKNVSVIVQHTGAVFFCGCRSVNEALEIRQQITKMITRY